MDPWRARAGRYGAGRGERRAPKTAHGDRRPRTEAASGRGSGDRAPFGEGGVAVVWELMVCSSDGGYGDGAEGAAAVRVEETDRRREGTLKALSESSYGRRGGGDGVATGARLASPLAGKQHKKNSILVENDAGRRMLGFRGDSRCRIVRFWIFF